jgi:hypothetical protein
MARRVRPTFVTIAMCSALAALAILEGCSLDTSGSASDDSLGDGGVDSAFGIDSSTIDSHFAIDTASGTDAPTDTPIDTITTAPDTKPESPTCDTSACGTPSGTPKRMALVDRTVACPAGFKQTDVVEAMAGDACSCACTLAAPTCGAHVDIPTAFSDDGSCSGTGATLHPMTSGGCVNFGFSGALHSDFSATPPAPTGGGCTAKPTIDPSKITAQTRLCEPMAGACFGDVCGAPFDECIEVGGACPSDYPNAHTIATSIGATCPSCDCTFSKGSCTGVIDFYSATDCGTGTKITLAASGACVPVPGSSIGGGRTVQSYDYVPSTPTGDGCAPSFDTDPGAPTFGGPRNLCCR